MKAKSAREAKNSFGPMLDTARPEPVRPERHGWGVVLVISLRSTSGWWSGNLMSNQVPTASA